jgi:release factor glutamine methyltransferase
MAKPQLTWPIGQALKWIGELLKKEGFEQPFLEAELLMAHALHTKKINLYSHPEKHISENENQLLKNMLKRRLNREPMAYVLGYQPFHSFNFHVNRHVLIPRPETEVLIQAALEAIHSFGQRPVPLADIGTGSGIIPITLCKLCDKISFHATEISLEALKVAKKNSDYHKVSHQIEFLLGNMFEPLENQKFDIITSNPPYIRSSHIRNLQPEIRFFEPKAALDGGEDGLFFIKTILHTAPKHLNPGGYLIMEFGAGQSIQIQSLLLANGRFKDFAIKKDLNRLDRVLVAKL